MPRQQFLESGPAWPTSKAASDEGAKAKGPVFRAGADLLCAGAPRSRAEVMVEVATHLCCSGMAYEHMGRGPDAFDDLGLARACVQAALDWQVLSDAEHDGRPPAPVDPIPDVEDYAPSAWQFNPNALAAMAGDWGLERTSARGDNLSKAALPGDLIVYMGRGPRMGVVIAPWREPERWPHFESPAVATVWEGQPPAVARSARMSWTPLVLFRWPEVVR